MNFTQPRGLSRRSPRHAGAVLRRRLGVGGAFLFAVFLLASSASFVCAQNSNSGSGSSGVQIHPALTPVSGGGQQPPTIQPQPTPISSPPPIVILPTPPPINTDSARTWANAGSDFATGSNWGGTAPVAGDVALFSSVESVNPILGGSAAYSISGFFFNAAGVSGYDITRSSTGSFTLTGYNTSGSSGTADSSAAAIRGSNTSGTNTIEVPLTLAPASGTNSYFFQVGTGTLDVKGAITGSGITLNLNGGGTIELDGDNSSVTGGMVIGTTGEIVSIGNNNALGGTSGTGAFTINNSSTLQAVGGARSISNAVTLAGGTLTIGGSNDLTFNSSGSFTTSGAASRTVTVNNSGNTTLAGNVFLSSASGTGVALTINGTGATAISGVISNFNGSGTAGSLTYSGSNTLTLSGTNTYTGNTTVSGGGTISVSSIGNSGANGNVGAGTTINMGGGAASGTLLYTGSGETTSKIINLTGTTGGATIDQSGASGLLKFTGTNTATGAGIKTLTLQGSTAGTGEIAGAIVDNTSTNKTSLVKAGTGTWALSGTNTYTGTTTVNGGTLRFAKEVSLYNDTTASWTATNITVASGATAAFNVGGTGEFTSADIDTLKALGTGSGGFTSGSTIGFDTTNASGGTFTYASSIANPNSGANVLGLTKLGSGTLLLTGNSTYTGTTTINNGTLTLDNNNTTTPILAGTTKIVINSGGTLLLAQSGGTASIDRINDAATMTLNGGTFSTGGLSEHGASNNTAGIGALTLQSSSIINMTSPGSVIAFANSSAATWAGTLSIYNWAGTPVTGGGPDQVYFGSDATGLTATQVGEITFFSDAGTTSLGGAMILADGEVVPVPEPSTWAAAALMLSAIACMQRRRIARSFKV